MLHNGQRLTNRIVQPCSLRWRLYGREPYGISIGRSAVLRFQDLLKLGHAVLDGVPRGAVQSMQKAAQTRTDSCQLSVIQRWNQGLRLTSRALRQLRCEIRLHGREKGLAFGSPFIGQGPKLIGTPRFYAHDSSPCTQERRPIMVYCTAFSRWKCVVRPAPGPGYVYPATTLGLATTSLYNRSRGISANSSNK